MQIWFPTLRAGSGSDVYVERLVAALNKRGVDARLQWFDRRFELQPGLLRYVRPPVGTDLIHASSWNGFAFAKKNIPLVITAFHCVYRNGYPAWKTLTQRLYHDYWIGKFEGRTFKRASAVVAMTPSAAADFSHHFTLPALRLIHGWVDTDIFRPIGTFPGSGKKIHILIVGNGSKRKGVDLLPKLRAKLDNRFLITIIGGLRADWQGKSDGIIFKSGLSQSELVREYQQANLVVSLSRYEGFGYTVLEAMACATPVVAFDVTGIRDIVDPGVTGFLAKLEDIDALANLCERVGCDAQLADEMGRAGRALAVEHFAEEGAIKMYLEMYSSLMD